MSSNKPPGPNPRPRHLIVIVPAEDLDHPELGVVSPWSGQGFGFLGDVEGGVTDPTGEAAGHTVIAAGVGSPKEVTAPTWTKWNAHCGVDACKVHIRGEELMTMETREDAGRRVQVAKLQYLPWAWAGVGGGAVPAPATMIAASYEPSNRDRVYSPFEQHEQMRTACGLL